MKNAIILLFIILAITISAWAEDGPIELNPTNQTEDPAPKPYGTCNLFLLKAVDTIKDIFGRATNRLDHSISRVREWNLSPEDEVAIASIFTEPSNSTTEKQFERAFYALTKARLNSMNPVSRFFSRKGMIDGIEQTSIYAQTIGKLINPLIGPHYNPIFNRSSTHSRPGLGPTPLDTFLAIHEGEHLSHRNLNPIYWAIAIKVITVEMFMTVIRTPLSVPIRRQQEVRAIGAQWELAKRIPLEIRKKILATAEEKQEQISHRERILTYSLYHSGIMNKLSDIVIKGLALDSIDQTLIETSLLYALLKGPSETKWFKTFRKRAKKNISLNEMALIKGINNRGIDFELIRNELEQYISKHSEQEILNSAKIAEWRVKIIESILSDIRYSKSLDKLEKIYLGSLKFADLSKEEFIRRLSIIQGYTFENINQTHYKSPMRAMVFYIALFPLVVELFEGKISSSIAVDIDLILKLVKSLMVFQ